ncbi:MAG: hypothetical protein K5647_03045 [Clostridiales bacterium]|nr:hypothetical protein [Clostridiales bacterium]
MDLLSSLPMCGGVITRQISAENPTGEKSGAARAMPDPSDPALFHSGPARKLGKGWKVNPFIRVQAGETVTLADIKGPGVITEFFITRDYPRLFRLRKNAGTDNEK